MGILSIIIGLILLSNSFIAALSLPWVVGIFAIFGGIFVIIVAFKIR